MQRHTKWIAYLCFLITFGRAYAVPSFSRQTGLACNVCHSNPPELTAFGRNFKLTGFVINDMSDATKIGNEPNLQLSRNIPISFMVLLSDTAYPSVAPSTQNSAVGFPQQLSVFLAGGFASHFGGMAQVTYTHAGDHFSMDNTDLRFANQTKVQGKDLSYGITLNNNPTVEDLWNSTPAWGYPFNSSAGRVSPIASPIIAGALGQDVAGLGAYAMWNSHLYAAATLYRSEHGAGPVPIDGVNYQYNISAAAPYWRVAWQQTFGPNYLMIGTYGIGVNSHPHALTGPVDRYLDPSVDFQYERPFGDNLLDAHGTWTHEASNLGATFVAGGASTTQHHLDTFKLDSTYHWKNKYTATGAYFATTGHADPILYASAPLTGSANGSPNNSGYTAQLAYWPVQNIDLNLNYTGYTKFNGARTNYDGAGRNASDNNSVYMSVWLNF